MNSSSSSGISRFLPLAITVIAVSVAVALWVTAHTAVQRDITRPEPIPLGNGFEGNVRLPAAEFSRRYEEGSKKFATLKSHGERLGRIATAADWFAFALTSLVALVAGYFGFVAGPTGLKPAEVEKLLKQNAAVGDRTRKTGPMVQAWIRWLGVLAAASSVSIGAASRARVAQADALKAASAINDALWTARGRWFEAKSETEAAVALKELERALLAAE